MTNRARDTAYAVNKRIVADDFDDETVLINVEKGLYFSMQGSATEIWRAFEEPQLRSQAVAVMSQDLSAADREEIDNIVQSMIDHDLLIEAKGDCGDHAKLFSFAATAFTTPVLGIFSDLAELIAIDPVHEVDENAGWPVRPPSFPPTVQPPMVHPLLNDLRERVVAYIEAGHSRQEAADHFDPSVSFAVNMMKLCGTVGGCHHSKLH